jgi:hypothetical protein
MMVESDPTLSILTIFLVISTSAVAFATFLVWKATKKMVKVTKEIASLPIMPRLSIVGHNKIGQDDQHDHYQFSFKNLGVGNAFDIQIESFHKEGSRGYPIVSDVGINAATSINNMSVDKNAKKVRFKISYRDYADNLYIRDFFYDFETGTDRGTYGSKEADGVKYSSAKSNMIDKKTIQLTATAVVAGAFITIFYNLFNYWLTGVLDKPEQGGLKITLSGVFAIVAGLIIYWYYVKRIKKN